MHGCKTFLLLTLYFLSACTTYSSSILVRDKEIILIDIINMDKAREKGEIDLLFSLTHESTHKTFGSKLAYETALTDSYLKLDEMGFKVVEFRIGKLRKIHDSENAQLVIVPRESIYEVGNCRWKSVSYIVAIQEKAANKWKYFFSSSLQNREITFWDLFPYVARSVNLPPNYVEGYRPPCGS